MLPSPADSGLGGRGGLVPPAADSGLLAAPVAEAFNTAAIQAAIREAQQLASGYTYTSFCRKVTDAGCAGYIVSFTGRRAVYFGRTAETHVIVSTYLGLAAVLVVMAAVVWLRRQRLPRTVLERASLHGYLELLRRVRFIFGAGCIFLYVGAEVAIGSLMVSYLMQSNVFDLGPEAAGKKLIYYWGGAMVGRFIGAYLLRVFSPGKVLASVAAVAIALLCISGSTTGLVCGCALLAVGLFNSIMFPTIFSLACEKLGPRAAEGSGIICVAIVGGAIVPLITGHAADWVGLRAALIVPALCYAGIVSFGIYARRPA